MAIKRYLSELTKLIKSASYGHSAGKVFSNFVEMAAIAISNAVDWAQKDKREERYLEIINQYDKKQQPLFGQMLGILVEALEYALAVRGPEDVLGPLFHELELHNEWAGQFFTPNSICVLMGGLMVGDGRVKQAIETKGYVTLDEPCTGSGAMILGFANAMRRQDLNFQTQLLVSAQDIDLKCTHMTYIQLSLLHIPARVVHGDTISLKEWSYWYTPAYILNGWRLRKRRAAGVQSEPIQLTLF